MPRAALLAFFVLLAFAGGCGADRAVGPSSTVTITESETTTIIETVAPEEDYDDAVTASVESLSGEYASVDYPTGWTVDIAET